MPRSESAKRAVRIPPYADPKMGRRLGIADVVAYLTIGDHVPARRWVRERFLTHKKRKTGNVIWWWEADVTRYIKESSK